MNKGGVYGHFAFKNDVRYTVYFSHGLCVLPTAGATCCFFTFAISNVKNEIKLYVPRYIHSPKDKSRNEKILSRHGEK